MAGQAQMVMAGLWAKWKSPTNGEEVLTLRHAAAQSSLHRRYQREAARCVGWTKEGHRHCGAQRLGTASVVEAGRMAAPCLDELNDSQEALTNRFPETQSVRTVSGRKNSYWERRSGARSQAPPLSPRWRISAPPARDRRVSEPLLRGIAMM